MYRFGDLFIFWSFCSSTSTYTAQPLKLTIFINKTTNFMLFCSFLLVFTLSINALIFCLLFRMSIGVVRGIEMVSKWCLIKNIRIEGKIVALLLAETFTC